MEALGGGNGWLWGWNWEPRRRKPHHYRSKKGPISSDSFGGSFSGYQFPIKQAVTAGSLALTGDTIAQLTQRRRNVKASAADDHNDNHHGQYQDFKWNFLSEHDWLRAIRMASYGVLLYGPGSYAWYQYLDHCLPQPTVKNLMLKVLLNQIVLGPSVIAVVFAWNNLWQGKLSQLPEKYRKDALPTLLNGFRFWIPVSVLNFWVVPLQARVAFMSMGSIFWNFCLSSTMSK